jgi:hypothetical protein
MYRRVLLKTRPACRSYVGLAFNEKKSGIETIDRSLKSFQRTAASVTNSTISQVGQGTKKECTRLDNNHNKRLLFTF